jgi:hypothetical protein
MNWLTDPLLELWEFFKADPLHRVAVVASAVALASAPLAIAWMGTQKWFQARRGRVTQRPSFAAVIVATLLTMGVPAIVLALLIKSQYFDRDRYEFDPNRIPSVLDQGRQYEGRTLYESATKADEAVRSEMKRLAQERKGLVEAVKRLDAAMLPLSEAALATPGTTQTLPPVVEALALVRKSVGVDATARWQELTAILEDPERQLAFQSATLQQQPAVIQAAAAQPVKGLAASQFSQEIAAVPAAQQALAALLPLNDVPDGWEVGKLGSGHLETFNAENLYEKINGRAESFTQYDVQGLAYGNFHPKGDEASGEVQLYVFEFASPLKAFGKYGSEKPQDAQVIAIGSEGYEAAGSVSFHQGKYFVQVVSTSDEPRFAAFSSSLAKIVSSRIGGPKAAATPVANLRDANQNDADANDPAQFFKHLPEVPNRQQPQYVAQDAFGYSFLSDVFLADYKEGSATWQAFLRPYESMAAAGAVFEKYLDTAKADGAEIQELTLEGASRAVFSSNIGLFDLVFLKGNTVAGINGATEKDPALDFARGFAKQMPKELPALAATPARASTNAGEH